MYEKGVFGWLKVKFVKWCEDEKCEENGSIFRNTYLGELLCKFPTNFFCRDAYMEGI